MLSLKWEPLDDTAEPRQEMKTVWSWTTARKMSLCGFLPALLCDDFQVAAAAVLIPPRRLPPLLSPSSSEWPSSPSGCGHGARRWVLLLSPSNQKKSRIYWICIPQSWFVIRNDPLSFTSVGPGKMQAVALPYHKGMWDFPQKQRPPLNNGHKKVWCVSQIRSLCALGTGSCRGRQHWGLSEGSVRAL